VTTEHRYGRRLPPLNALRAFEATARHLSFKRAADELHVTYSAVSHQIRTLEQFLGIALFRRFNRSIMLTPAGKSYLPTIREAFDKVDQATLRLMNVSLSGGITISCFPSFAARWLLPRLPGFFRQNPDLEVHISATQAFSHIPRDDVDVAIRYGDGNWPGFRADKLFDDWIFPVCSPAMADGSLPLRHPQDLRHHRLLHDTNSPDDWKRWLQGAGVEGIDAGRGLSFSHSMLVLQAAAEGLGVAIAHSPLLGDDLATGRLARPFQEFVPTQSAYYFISPEHNAEHPKIIAFREWIMSESAANA